MSIHWILPTFSTLLNLICVNMPKVIPQVTEHMPKQEQL